MFALTEMNGHTRIYVYNGTHRDAGALPARQRGRPGGAAGHRLGRGACE